MLCILYIFKCIYTCYYICFCVNKAVLPQISMGSSFTRDFKMSRTVLRFAKKPTSTVRKSETFSSLLRTVVVVGGFLLNIRDRVDS